MIWNEYKNGRRSTVCTHKIVLRLLLFLIAAWFAIPNFLFNPDALIEQVDDQVGLLLDTLGDDVNKTLILFTSDHGEMLGAHGMVRLLIVFFPSCQSIC